MLNISAEGIKGSIFEELKETDNSIRFEHIEIYYASLDTHKELLKAT
jgi:hypothetical protein